MTFDEWWKKMKPAECDELKPYFEEAWVISAKADREACVVSIKNLLDSHCAATGDCDEGCDFVTAWESAIDELRKRSNA